MILFKYCSRDKFVSVDNRTEMVAIDAKLSTNGGIAPVLCFY